MYPFKDLSYVFVELLNFHSHSDRNITVLLKESTTNHLAIDNNYIVNITHVTISTYSSLNNTAPSRALIKGLDHNSIQSHPGTQFSILSDFELQLDKMLLGLSTITAHEKTLINEENSLFTVVRSSLTLNNIDFTTTYETQKDK